MKFTLEGWTYSTTKNGFKKSKYRGCGKWSNKTITIQEYAAADSEYNRKQDKLHEKSKS